MIAEREHESNVTQVFGATSPDFSKKYLQASSTLSFKI